MTQALAERRAYARGYAAGHKRSWQWARFLLDLVRSYRDRSTVKGERHCADCRRWVRGHGTARWGTCLADFDRGGVEPLMWVDRAGRVGGPPAEAASITTHDNFGCVNWLPKEGPRG